MGAGDDIFLLLDLRTGLEGDLDRSPADHRNLHLAVRTPVLVLDRILLHRRIAAADRNLGLDFGRIRLHHHSAAGAVAAVGTPDFGTPDRLRRRMMSTLAEEVENCTAGDVEGGCTGLEGGGSRHCRPDWVRLRRYLAKRWDLRCRTLVAMADESAQCFNKEAGMYTYHLAAHEILSRVQDTSTRLPVSHRLRMFVNRTYHRDIMLSQDALQSSAKGSVVMFASTRIGVIPKSLVSMSPDRIRGQSVQDLLFVSSTSVKPSLHLVEHHSLDLS